MSPYVRNLAKRVLPVNLAVIALGGALLFTDNDWFAGAVISTALLATVLNATEFTRFLRYYRQTHRLDRATRKDT